ncbi:hypothetical protein ACQPW1_10385 [Nocardia sp. CA-128927]|uniref:hypothetical protein n=1 Tax=Nocardia sp. CA-128927 TaxID=3239975 RepID=UPI003D96B4EB
MNANFDPGAAAARIDEIDRHLNEENALFETEENAGRITGRAAEKHYELIEAYEEERQILNEQLKSWRAVHGGAVPDYDPDQIWQRIASITLSLQGSNDALADKQDRGQDELDDYRRIEVGSDELLDLKAGLLDWLAQGGRPPAAWVAE